MAEISDLIRQRDALDKQIRAEQQTAAQRYDDALDALYEATLEVAAYNELEVRESQRKNETTVHLDDGWLTVHIGRAEPQYGAFFNVRTRGGIVADFSGELPPARALTGYLNGLIEDDRADQADQADGTEPMTTTHAGQPIDARRNH